MEPRNLSRFAALCSTDLYFSHLVDTGMAYDAVFVLVVEDEVLIRMSLVDQLEDAGFRVLEAGTADEALSVMADHPEIDALFTDIDMPGSMDGLKLARLVSQSRPELAVLLTSGYLKIPRNELPGKAHFFSKPYDVNRIIDHLRGIGTSERGADCADSPFTR
jgi:CheY-like chemotaxis protein